jgi:hypothetical protein
MRLATQAIGRLALVVLVTAAVKVQLAPELPVTIE